MGLADILLGRKKLKGPAQDRLFALSTARVTLDTELGLKTAGSGGIVFKPLSAGEFVRAENDLQQVLDAVAGESGSRLERKSDDFGYEWIVVRDADLEDQVTTVHAVAQGLQEAGFGEQLLAAAFKFEPKFGDRKVVYWVYGYKQGAFWPFVPTGEKDRDNAEELELKAKLDNELPIEPDLSRWFGLFNAPLWFSSPRRFLKVHAHARRGASPAHPVLEPNAEIRKQGARKRAKNATSRSPSARPGRRNRLPSSASRGLPRLAIPRPSVRARGRADSGRT